MTLRILLATGALATLLAQPAWARDLTVATPGGAWQDALRQVMFEPFTQQTHLPLDAQSFDEGIGLLRTRIENGTNTFDVVQVPDDALLIGCDEGLFAKLDWTRLGGKDRLQSQAASDCGEGFVMDSVVLSWDRDKFPATPTWVDFWDVAKYPGKRGLRRGVRTNLEIALLADGVAPGDVYGTLRTDAGVERAFRKLDQLKPYIVWWHSDAEAARILASGEVLMTSAPSSTIAVANRSAGRHFGVQWNGGLTMRNSLVIVKGSPNTDAAYSLLNFAADPARQKQLTALVPVSGLAKGATDGLPPEVQAVSPAAHLSAGLLVDDQFWRDNLDKLSQRFNAWLAH